MRSRVGGGLGDGNSAGAGDTGCADGAGLGCDGSRSMKTSIMAAANHDPSSPSLPSGCTVGGVDMGRRAGRGGMVLTCGVFRAPASGSTEPTRP